MIHKLLPHETSGPISIVSTSAPSALVLLYIVRIFGAHSSYDRIFLSEPDRVRENCNRAWPDTTRIWTAILNFCLNRTKTLCTWFYTDYWIPSGRPPRHAVHRKLIIHSTQAVSWLLTYLHIMVAHFRTKYNWVRTLCFEFYTSSSSYLLSLT